MTNPLNEEQLQAISDERLAQLITVERGRSALYVETAIQGQTLTLVEDRLSALLELQSLRALQSLDREGVNDRIIAAIDELRREEGAAVEILCDNPDFNGQPNNAVVCNADWTRYKDHRVSGHTLVQALENAVEHKRMAIEAGISALSPQPETAKEAPREKALSRISQKLAEEGGGTWAAYMMLEIGEAYGCSPAAKEVEETEAWHWLRNTAENICLKLESETATVTIFDQCELRTALEAVATHPAPQSPPAPVVGEGMKLLEENCWDMRCLSSPIADTGDADIVWQVIEHHMAKPMERVVGVGSTPQEALKAALEGRS